MDPAGGVGKLRGASKGLVSCTNITQRVQVSNIWGFWSPHQEGYSVLSQVPQILGTWTLWGAQHFMFRNYKMMVMVVKGAGMQVSTGMLTHPIPPSLNNSLEARYAATTQRQFRFTQIFVRRRWLYHDVVLAFCCPMP